MKTVQRISCLFLFVFVVFSISVAEASVTTTRDDKGVWFIEGDEDSSLYDVFEAMGYAVATDRLWQAETYRRMARGRLAEITGPGMQNQDMLARITGYTPEELTNGYENLDPEVMDMIDGYVDGFNRRIGEVSQDPSQLPFEFHAVANQLGEIFLPEPWTPEDVLAWQAALLRQFDPEANRQGQIDNASLLEFLTGEYGAAQGMTMFNDLRWENDPAAITYIPDQETAGAPITLSVRSGPSKAPVPGEFPALAQWKGVGKAAENINRLWSDREENLKKLGIYPKMGSYAWAISGDKTESGNPIIYSGPQMGFDVPSIVMEGSIDAAGMKVSGMAIPGLPGIVIGRTPHHAWSMQVGHARTVDYYFEPEPSEVENYYTSRMETIEVAGQDSVVIPVYRTPNGPVVNPVPFNPANYDPTNNGPIISWRYAHWEKEFDNLQSFLELARAESMDDFGEALLGVAVSQNFCYADRDGNIAYWMSGVDPIRPEVDNDGNPVDWRLPQGMLSDPVYWDADNRKPLSADRNTEQGFYAGWNNKAEAGRVNAINNTSYSFGPFHRTHVLNEYLLASDILTYEEIRDLALYIATTDSFGSGGNPYAYVEENFRAAVQNNPTPAREEAIEILGAFDGHFVAGGEENWVDGMDRSDGWILADAWIREVLRLTFADELAGSQEYDADTRSFRSTITYFNVLLHALAGDDASLVKQYDWFQNLADPEAPQTADEIIVAALDAVLVELPLNDRPWGADQRGEIEFNHRMFNAPVHTIPFASRSTYAHVVEMADYGQSRIESMFPLGQSGTILLDGNLEREFDDHFFSMTEVFDDFSHREFPVFETDIDDDDSSSSSSTCFIKTLFQGSSSSNR